VADSTEEGLVKVIVDLPDDASVGAESMWAKPVGPELYELRNSPWHAYDLHFGDVVRAVADSPDEKPRVRKVVRPSGHKTLRVIFATALAEPRQIQLLSQLALFGASYERASAQLVAMDVLPEGDYQHVCDMLWSWEQEGLLEYETGTR
jgi:Domain of unknown function (DUF4265)